MLMAIKTSPPNRADEESWLLDRCRARRMQPFRLRIGTLYFSLRMRGANMFFCAQQYGNNFMNTGTTRSSKRLTTVKVNRWLPSKYTKEKRRTGLMSKACVPNTIREYLPYMVDSTGIFPILLLMAKVMNTPDNAIAWYHRGWVYSLLGMEHRWAKTTRRIPQSREINNSLLSCFHSFNTPDFLSQFLHRKRGSQIVLYQ